MRAFARRTVALSIVGGLLAGGCQGGASGDGDDDGGAEVIKLLYAMPLTGSGADLGITGCDGAEFAATQINEAGGLEGGPHSGATIEVSCVDNEASADTSATIANDYVADPDIWTLMGFYGSGEAQAAGIQAARANLSVLGSNVGAAFLTEEADNIVVVGTPPLSSYGTAWVDFCGAYYGAEAVGDLSPDYAYIPDYRAGRDRGLEQSGLTLVGEETYPGGEVHDFAPYLTRLSNSGADCLLVGSFPPEQCQIAAQARDLGIAAPIVDFTGSGTGQSCVEAAGDAYTGLVFSVEIPLPPPPGSLFERVNEEYRDQFGEDMNAYAVRGYDSVLVVKYAIEAGAESREQLLDYVKQIDGEGLGGTLEFTEDLRPGPRTLTFLEATAPELDALDPVAQYVLNPDLSIEVVYVAECADRETCQLNLSG